MVRDGFMDQGPKFMSPNTNIKVMFILFGVNLCAGGKKTHLTYCITPPIQNRYG